MNISNEEYQELVYKLAGEIVDEAGMEVEASVGSVAKGAFAKAGKIVNGYKSTVSGKGVSSAKETLNNAMNGGTASSQYLPEAKQALIKAQRARAGAIGGTGAVAAGGIGATIAAARHKKEASEYEDYGFDKQAAEEAYIGSVIEKAASVYEEAQSKIAAAMEVLAEAELEENAAIEVMAQLGLFED